MTRENGGHYATKHPSGSKPDERIANAIHTLAPEGRLSCASAFQIAQKFSLQPIDVGRTADLLEIRFNKCQLGLFGYDPQKTIVEPASSVDPNLEKALYEGLVNGRLPCVAAFTLAEQFAIPRMTVASACEGLGLKVCACQIGAF